MKANLTVKNISLGRQNLVLALTSSEVYVTYKEYWQKGELLAQEVMQKMQKWLRTTLLELLQEPFSELQRYGQSGF